MKVSTIALIFLLHSADVRAPRAGAWQIPQIRQGVERFSLDFIRVNMTEKLKWRLFQ